MVTGLSVGRVVVVVAFVVVVVFAAVGSDGPEEVIAFVGLSFAPGWVVDRPLKRFDMF